MSGAWHTRTLAAYLEHRPRLSAKFDSAEDLERLSVVLTKDDLRRNYPWGLLSVPRERVYQYHESFGTTGTPIASPLTREDLQAYVDQVLLTPLQLGALDLVLVRFPYAISTPAHLFHHAAQARGAAVVAASSYTPISSPARVLRLIEQLGVTVLTCLPFEAVRLAHFARWQGYQPGEHFRSLRAICTAGEVLGPAMSRYIESLWRAPVYSFYGSTEAGNVARSCRHGKLHLAEEHFDATVVDDSLERRALPGAQGTLVLTTHNKEALPLFKYDTEDQVTLSSPNSCPCGNPDRVLELFGRRGEHYDVDDPMSPSGKRRVLHATIKDRIYEVAQEHGTSPFFRCSQQERRLVLTLETAQHADPTLDPNVAPNVERTLQERLGVDVEVNWVRAGALLDMEALTRSEPVNKPKFCF